VDKPRRVCQWCAVLLVRNDCHAANRALVRTLPNRVHVATSQFQWLPTYRRGQRLRSQVEPCGICRPRRFSCGTTVHSRQPPGGVPDYGSSSGSSRCALPFNAVDLGAFFTLHGGSGTADGDFLTAMQTGLTIIHINKGPCEDRGSRGLGVGCGFWL